MKFFICILTVILVSGCSSVAKQQRKAEAFYNAHPEKLAYQCAEKYPVKDSAAAPDTTIKKATNKDYSNLIDSLLAVAESNAKPVIITDSNCINQYKNQVAINDALRYRIGQLKKEYKPCEPDTAFITKIIYRENTARVTYYKYKADSTFVELQKTNVRLDDAKDSARGRLIIAIILGVALTAGIVAKLKNII